MREYTYGTRGGRTHGNSSAILILKAFYVSVALHVLSQSSQQPFDLVIIITPMLQIVKPKPT